MSRRTLLFWIAASVIFAGCRSSDQKLIQNLLDKRTHALENGDARNYFSCMSLDYEDSFFPFNSASYEIRQVFSSADRPAFKFSSPKIYHHANRAVVREDFSLEGVIAQKARRLRRTQHLRLKKYEGTGAGEDSGWKIESGSQVYRLLAGQAEEEDKIVEVLDLREKALEGEDSHLYISVVSKDYEHRGKRLSELQTTLKETFRVFDNIRYEAWDRKISYYGNYAMVVQSYRLEANLMGEPRVDSGTEQFEMVPEAEGWRIIKGL